MRTSLNHLHTNLDTDHPHNNNFKKNIQQSSSGSHSDSDIVDNSVSGAANEFQNFFVEDKPQPKFKDQLGKGEKISRSFNSRSDEDSPSYGETEPDKNPFQFDQKTSEKGFYKNNFTITFNEVNTPMIKSPNSVSHKDDPPSAIKTFGSTKEGDIETEKDTENNKKLKVNTWKPSSSLYLKIFKNDKEGESKQINLLNRSPATSSTMATSEKVKSNTEAHNSTSTISRAMIRAAITKALGNRVFDPTEKELNLIKDKSFVPKKDNDDNRQRLFRQQNKGHLRVKNVLQKNGIISSNIKGEDLKRIMRDIKRARTWKQSCLRAYQVLRAWIRKNIKFVKIFKKIFKQTISPGGKFLLFWDITSAVFILYDIILIPIQIGFGTLITGFFEAFELIENFFFMFDLLLNFRTQYYDEGVLITDYKAVTKQYLKTWFILDFTAVIVSMLALGFFISSSSVDASASNALRILKFLRFARFLRVFRVLKLKRYVTELETFINSNIYQSIKSLVSLLLYIIFLAHIAACIWHFVGTNPINDPDETWIIKFGFEFSSLWERYVASLFWAVTTMLTVGYGDITPTNTAERLVNISIMLAGCGLFAYSMNSIGTIVHNLNAESSQKRLLYYNINKYMEKMKVSKPLRSKVMQYLNYMNENQRYGKLAEGHVFSVLSDSLKEEIVKDINGRALTENNIFAKNFDKSFLKILSNKLGETTVAPGEVIFDVLPITVIIVSNLSQETDKSCTLYLISSGIVEIYLRHCDTVISHIGRDMHFGELSFFTGRLRSASARAQTFTHIFYITKDVFLSLIEDFHTEWETYHLIKDQMNVYNNFSMLQVNCIVCGSQRHDSRYCDRVHFIPDRSQVLNSYFKERDESHLCFKRPKRRRFIALTDREEVYRRAVVYARDYPKEIKKISALEDRKSKFFGNNKLSKNELENGVVSESKQRSANHITANQTISEENFTPTSINLDAWIRKKSLSRLQDKLHAQKGSFATDDDEDDSKKIEYPSPLLIASQRRSFLQDRQEGKRKERPSQRVLKSIRVPMINIEQPLSVSMMEEQYLRAAEGSYLLQELQRLEQQSQQSFNFDQVCNFSVYFPHNNISRILEALRKEQHIMRKRANSKVVSHLQRVSSLAMENNQRAPSLIKSKFQQKVKQVVNHDWFSIMKKDSQDDSMRSKRPHEKKPIINTAVLGFLPEAIILKEKHEQHSKDIINKYKANL